MIEYLLPHQVGILGIAMMLLLLVFRIPVAIAMLIVGFLGIGILNGWSAAMSVLGGEAFVIVTFYELSVIPLFILMGNLASVSGMSRDLYDAAYSWFGHWRGGLASSTIVGCAGFAALSGSSIASAVTMGRVSLPQMKRYHYNDQLSTGCIAAGGTLGILIPPSTGFVIYAILTEESIGRLFMAGVLPGLLLTALFMGTIYLITRFRPEFGPSGPKANIQEKWAASRKASTILVIVLITIGGIYGGIFTPVEAAGIGAFLSLLVALLRRSLDLLKFCEVLLATMRTSALSFLILIGAHVFSPFIALTHIPDIFAEFLNQMDLGPNGILLIILAIYIVLGTFLEGFAMLVLTLPIFYPLIVELGFSPIWFGVMAVIVLEMGLISPPVGVNVFVVKGIAEDVPMRTIFLGIMPFWGAMLICLLFLLAFPDLALLLPNSMYG